MLSRIKRWLFGPPIEELFAKYPDFTEFCKQKPMKHWEDSKKFKLLLGEENYINICCRGSLFDNSTHVWAEGYVLPKKIERDLVRIVEYFRWQFDDERKNKRAQQQAALDEQVAQHWSDTQKDPMLNVEKN